MENLFTDCTKIFSHKIGCYSVSLCREDFESLVIPMIAEEMSDEKMNEIAFDVCKEMTQEFDQSELALFEKYKKTDGIGMPCEDIRTAERVADREFEFLERRARQAGMRYWEDIPEDEADRLLKLLGREI